MTPRREPMWRRLARFYGPDTRRDVDDEFAFHLAEREAEYLEAGLSPSAARDEALRRFGDLQGARAACAATGARSQRRRRFASSLDGIVLDVRHALRGLRRQPGFVACVVLTVALGIGVNAALFSVVNALLLRPLPVLHPEQLVRVYTSEGRTLTSPRDRFGGTSYADHSDLRALRHAFAGVAAYMPVGVGLRAGDQALPLTLEAVSGDYFNVLGVRATLGRALVADDDGRAPTPVVVLGHALWRDRFGADSAIIGRSVSLSGAPFTVVGIAPPEFAGLGFQSVDGFVPFGAVPLLLGDTDHRVDRGYRVAKVIARLAPGVTLAEAERHAARAMTDLARAYPETNAGRLVSLKSARTVVGASTADDAPGRIALLLLAITATVFAVALLNVASLVLSRATTRARDLAVRLALGAGRGRLVRLLLIDGALLAGASAIVAAVVVATLPMLARTVELPPAVRLAPDWRVLLFVGAASALAALALGIAPLALVRSASHAGALRGGAIGTSRRSVLARRMLVAAQLSLAVLLLVVGLGLVQSLRRQQDTGPGFAVNGLLVARFRDVGAPSNGRDNALAAELVRRAANAPGVASVTTAVSAPLTSDGMRMSVTIPGYAPARGEDMEVHAAYVGADYFRTLGIRIRAGAELAGTLGDTASRVVVNASMARRYWGTRDPVGSELRLGGANGRPLRVIAVADDIRLLSLAEAPRPTFFVQRPLGGTTLLVRASGDPGQVQATLRSRLGDVPGDFTLEDVAAMSDVVGESLIATRLAAAGVGAFSALTLVLALVGLYGVVNFVVSQRMHEFGVRMALGARPRDLLLLVLRGGVALAGGAAVAGIALGLAGARAVASVAPGVESPTMATVLAVACLLLVAALTASVAPARRANRVDPVVALRAE